LDHDVASPGGAQECRAVTGPGPGKRFDLHPGAGGVDHLWPAFTDERRAAGVQPAAGGVLFVGDSGIVGVADGGRPGTGAQLAMLLGVEDAHVNGLVFQCVQTALDACQHIRKLLCVDLPAKECRRHSLDVALRLSFSLG
jgi:hypothetical protein